MNVLARTMSFVVALTSAVCLMLPHAQAISYSWNDGAGGDWTTEPTKWTPNGDPNGAGDDVSFGNIGGAYTTTLNAFRTIGGLSLTGADPTLSVNSLLLISGGSSTVGGSALLNGTGVIELRGGAGLTYSSSTAPGGSLTFLVQPGQSASVTNTGNFGIASGQNLLMSGPAISATSTLTFSNGFSSSGLIQLGNVPPGDNFTQPTLKVTAGTLTNNVGGQIKMYPRSAASLGTPHNFRLIDAQLDNDGTMTVFTPDGHLRKTGGNHVNDGTMTIDSSIITGAGGTADLLMTGSSFTNNGTVNINDGRFTIATDTFTFAPATGTFNATGGILGFGGRGTPTVVNWNAADETDTMTFQITAAAAVTLNRTSAWTLPSNQVLHFGTTESSAGVTSLTLNQNFNNDGLVRMGSPAPGDNFTQAHLIIPSGTFTNNAGGQVIMHSRSATSLGDPWQDRFIEADVQNNGTIDVQTVRGQLGIAGKTVVNAGQINVDSSVISGAGGVATLTILGNSFTNTSAGTINADGARFRVGTSTYTYDTGSYSFDGGIFGFGPLTGGTTTVTWNGPDLSDDMTFEVTAGATVVMNRTTPWTLLSNQELHFVAPGSAGTTMLTLNQDFNNSGLVQMGKPTPGDNFTNAQFSIPSGTFMNNASGTVTMYPRSATSFADPWQNRFILADVQNNGSIDVLTIKGQLGTTGKTVVNAGTISLDSSIISGGGQSAGLAIIGNSFTNTATGRIQGNGDLTVTGAGGLMNNGTLAPGLSAGTLDILGNVTNSATSALEIELGGLIVGTEYDQLNISQTFVIDGELLVTLIDGFETTVTNSDVFTITTFGNSTGTFSNLTDGRVTIQDLLIDSRTYNFLVTIDATSIILSEFEINPVPEPSSLALLGLGMFGLIGRARRNRRRS